MKNYSKSGKIVDLVAPSGGVVSGNAYLFGSLLVVAQASAAEGETFAGMRMGEFSLPKLTSDNLTVGQKVNWNDTNDEFQAATSDLDDAATVVEAADNTKSEVKVVLTPV